MKRNALYLVCLMTLGAGQAVAADDDGKWPALSTAVGLQMWQPIYMGGTADMSAVDPAVKPTIGGVLKVNYLFGENMGAHFRGTYGVHSTTAPNRDAEGEAWAVGLGMDVFHAISDKVLLSNTMGFGYGQSSAKFEGAQGPDTTSLGAYFITTLDITVFGPVGFWMDWGCQVVGPSTAKYNDGEITTWHINPLGAGGLRIAL